MLERNDLCPSSTFIASERDIVSAHALAPLEIR